MWSALVALTLSAAAPAALVAGPPVPAHGGSVVFLIDDDQWAVQSGAANNRITLRYKTDEEALVISDTRGIESTSSLCSPTGPETVRCEMARSSPGVQVATGAGDDQVTVRRTLITAITLDGERGDDRLQLSRRVEVDASVYGAEGNDRLTGGRGDDYLSGGTGSDRVSGGPGNDQIRGGAAPDALQAGPGADRVDAANQDRDTQIGCGGSRDHANVDRRDTATRGCEFVRITK